MLNGTEGRLGIIKHRARAKQINDFSGLQYEKITPTDLDGFIDFDDRLFIFLEGKFVATPVQRGQQLAIDRLCDAAHNPPHRYAFAIIADHQSPPEEDIDFSSITVRSIRRDGAWRRPLLDGMTVRTAIDRMIAYVENLQGRPLVKKAIV
jgi:hypothetical protein